MIWGCFDVTSYVKDKGDPTERPTYLQKAQESGRGDSFLTTPAPIWIDVEMFHLGPRRCQHYHLILCQAHLPLDVELYEMKITERHAWSQVFTNKLESI